MSARLTARLLGLTLALAVLDVVVHRPPPPPSPNPMLPAIEAAERVRISSGDDLLELERRGEQWHITAPVNTLADPAAMKTLLAPLSHAHDLGPIVQEGDLERYNLVGSQAIHLVVDDEDGDRIDLWIGDTTRGGQSWVRLRDSDAVYRTSVGGKTRWTQSATSLRDRRLMQFSAHEVSRVQVQQQERTLTAQKTTSGWSFVERPEIPLDPLVMTQLTQALASWSGQRIVSASEAALQRSPRLGVRVMTPDGEQRVDVLRSETGWLAQRTDQSLLTFDPSLLPVLADPITMWRDRRLIALDASEVVQLQIRSAAGEATWQLTDQGWTQTSPVSRPAPSEMESAIQALAELRAVAWRDHDDPFTIVTWAKLTTRQGITQQITVASPLPDGSVPARSSINGQQTGTISPGVAAMIQSLHTFIE